MTVIYFTDGALIDDIKVRQALVRIPEVLGSLRESNHEFFGVDVINVMNSEEGYLSLNHFQKKYLKEIIQKSLFERLVLKKKIKFDLVLKKENYLFESDFQQALTTLSNIDNLKMICIGPGLDQNKYLSQIKNFEEAITQDHHLNWFWSDINKDTYYH